MKTTTEELVSHSPEETRRLAGDLLPHLPGRAVLALHGDLGSGKTCFVQGLALALGIRRAVTSPTFALIREYRGRRMLVHIDLYRIRSPDEALDLGMEEYLEADAVVAVEWAERAADLLPEDTIHLSFAACPALEERTVTIRHSLPQRVFEKRPAQK
jgi:tRNA threonylcarbamoyladenosine biosynthesis protein TsaE